VLASRVSLSAAWVCWVWLVVGSTSGGSLPPTNECCPSRLLPRRVFYQGDHMKFIAIGFTALFVLTTLASASTDGV
jgi:hypothetical protein